LKADYKDKILLFFDEVCELCSWFIQFVSKKDKKSLFLFSPLQGKTAKKYLDLKEIQSLSSFIVLKDNKLYREGEALKLILKNLYPTWSFFLLLIPPFFINKVYRFIAKRRYSWFGIRKDKSLPFKNSLLP